MHIRLLLIIALLGAIPAWPQVEPSATGGTTNSDEEMRMAIPPQVSGLSYASVAGGEAKSNYLSGGLALNTAYNSNVLVGQTSTAVSDLSYSVWPTIRLEQTTPRQSRSLIYSSGFTFYQRTSVLDSVNQNAAMNFQYRLSPHATLALQDSFQQDSNVYNQPYSISEGVISASPVSPTAVVITPFANQVSNTANADFSYQFNRKAMIGGGGTFALLNYTNPSQATGLYNSNTSDGVGFYNRRLSRDQYIGVIYQYSRIVTQSVNATTQLHTTSFFYSGNLHHALSFSLSSGAQHYNLALPAEPSSSSWSPYVQAGIGWRRGHASLGADYTRSITAGEGLLGAYNSESASGLVSWQLARAWTLGSAAGYTISKNATPFLSTSNPGGHGVSGTASIKRLLSEHISAELGYTRLHQSYSSVAVISNAPDNNRAFISISYEFTRPLGR